MMSDKCKLIAGGKFVTPFFFFLATLFFACKGQQSHYKSPRGYNLNKPQVIKLPAELDEVSGIAYYAKDNSIFCESDEHGNLYKVFLNKKNSVNKWKFSKVRDYEDIVLHDSVFYLLNSGGDIITVKFTKDSISTHKYEFPQDDNVEFESLYYEPRSDKLVLICKDCNADEQHNVSAYAFDYRSFEYTGAYAIDGSRVVEEAGSNKSNKYKPAAAGIHPINGKLYIVSSVNKALVIASRTGVIEEVYLLNPKIFHHPEGITFNAAGGMFISNESEDPKPANILYYEYKRNMDK
jgi:hypothetical protein